MKDYTNIIHAMVNQLHPTQYHLLCQYIEQLARWNTWQSLTAITDKDAMMIDHVIDALTLFPHIQADRKIIDLGSGPGLPGIPLAIMLPQVHFTLVDSHGKKTFFLDHTCRALALKNVTIIRSRFEKLMLCQSADCVVSRAVGPLDDLWHMAKMVLNQKGRLLAMKGHINSSMAQVDQSIRQTIHRVCHPMHDKTRHIIERSRR